MDLYIGSLFPSIIYLYVILIKEKYAGKNYKIIFRALLSGLIVFTLAYCVEKVLHTISESLVYEAFIVAATTEEAFRLVVLVLIIRRYKSNSCYEYLRNSIALSISFSGLENFAYVCYYFRGLETAAARLYTAVPLHILLGVVMASFLYKFNKSNKKYFLILAIIVPIIFHGFYDYFCFKDNFIIAFLGLIILFLVSFSSIDFYFKFNHENKGISSEG